MDWMLIHMGHPPMSNSSKTLGSTRDSVYMAVTEVMGLSEQAMQKAETQTLLVITLSGKDQSAALGGELTAESIEQVQSLLDELKRRAANEGDGDKVLHVWR